MTYNHIIEERLKFLNCDEQTHIFLDEFRELLLPEIDGMLDFFYEKILSTPALRPLFSSDEILEAARSGQKKHWLNVLFSKDFGKSHFENTGKIGATHERIGLTIGWYLNSYCLMLNKFVRLAADHYHDDPKKVTRMIQEINKSVFLDMNFVIESYLQSKDGAIRRVLSRTEEFTAEIKHIDGSIGHQAHALHSRIEAASKKLDLLQSLGHESHEDARKSKDREIKSIGEELASALKESTELATRIDGLKADFERLQKEHLLQYVPARKDGLLHKIKNLFSS